MTRPDWWYKPRDAEAQRKFDEYSRQMMERQYRADVERRKGTIWAQWGPLHICLIILVACLFIFGGWSSMVASLAAVSH
jgi:hypothetical protein